MNYIWFTIIKLMELNNYMRTHIPKKKIVVGGSSKNTFATLYSRFKKSNPEESPFEIKHEKSIESKDIDR